MRKYSYESDKGILYLVATPIGNLEDFTYRAVRILNEVDIIYAEDTRNSKFLLKHYNITTPLQSYHEFNKDVKSLEIVSKLKSGMNIAIISDAGLPVISDPGFVVAKEAIKENLAVTTLPGASAGISALVSSGLNPMPYMFKGFLDSKSSKRKAELLQYKYYPMTIIFYESPHRIKDTLLDVLEVLGDRQIVVARELTKKFEEYLRGSVSEVLEETKNIKGEMVLLISGYVEKKASSDNIDINQKIDELILLGNKPKEAIKEVSLMYNLDKSKVYKDYAKYKHNKVENSLG